MDTLKFINRIKANSKINQAKPIKSHGVLISNAKLNQSRMQQGFTIIEIMISIGISIFFLAGIVQLLISTSQTNLLNQASIAIHTRAQIAFKILNEDLRLVDYQGCADSNAVIPNIIANSTIDVNFTSSSNNTSLQGYSVNSVGTWSPAAPTSLNSIKNASSIKNAISGSDVITIQHGNGRNSSVSTTMTSEADTIEIVANDNINLDAGDLTLIANCENADIFYATDLAISSGGGTYLLKHETSQNSSSSLSTAYSTNANVMRFNSNTYFVADTGRRSVAGDNISSLFRMNESGVIEELVEGVESMKILYAQYIDSGNDATPDNARFVTADDVNLNMFEVLAIRVSLLMVSNQLVSTKEEFNTYIVPAGLVTPTDANTTWNVNHNYTPDKRLRAVISMTILLPNRIQTWES